MAGRAPGMGHISLGNPLVHQQSNHLQSNDCHSSLVFKLPVHFHSSL